MESTHNSIDRIAIIGSACRFPGGVGSPAQLWELLQDPKELVRELPNDRFSADRFYDPKPQFPNNINVKHAYTLTQDVRKFDASFFNISPTEARAMDPQQRMLLEVTYEGLERAGLTIESLKGTDTGVFVGMMWDDYLTMQAHDHLNIPTYSGTGTARSIAANRLSYFFDWHGPSVTLDTACSSSLVALHQAVRAIREGDCEVAIVAGVNLMFGPETFIQESQLKMLSPDGRCKMWDRDADGYGRGEGIAVLVVKRLGAATAHSDPIECIIRNVEISHDGSKAGLTKPNSTAQADLIRKTYGKAGLDIRNPQDWCQFFEAHGTGTAAGDPAEAEAIHQAFGLEKQTLADNHMYVGSIKTVIGHTESTAGIAGIMKAFLAMQNGRIPPNLHLRNINPAIAPIYGALEIPSRLIDWPQQPRRVSVNSFGFGGSNAHVILEGFEGWKAPVAKKAAGQTFTPFVFSAQSKASLIATLVAFSKHLAGRKNVNPVDLAWTLRNRRSKFRWRVAYAATTISSLQEQINETITRLHQDPEALVETPSAQRRVLGVFTGQGAQYAQMGAELLEKSPYCAGIVRDLEREMASLSPEDRPSWSIREELLQDGLKSRVNEPEISQTLCAVVQIVLVRLLTRLGFEFAAVVGHSSGEIGAAFAAGCLSAREAVLLAYFRGRYAKYARSRSGGSGAMLAVGTSKEDAADLCNLEEFCGKVVVAASNSPLSVTLAGDEEQIEQIRIIFEDEGKFCRRLKVGVAYHSHHMLPCSENYREAIERYGISGKEGKNGPRWFSSVIQGSDVPHLSSDYWIQNMLQPVLFDQAVSNAVLQTGCNMAIEIGPHSALKNPTMKTIQSILSQDSQYVVHVGTLERGKCATDAFAETLASLWLQNEHCQLNLDWYEEQISGVRDFSVVVDLPSYQWNHEHALPDGKSRYIRALYHQPHRFHPLLGHLCPTSSDTHLLWRNLLRLSHLPWLQGHKLQAQVVFPATGYLVTAIEAAMYLLGDHEEARLVELHDVQFHQAMIFPATDDGVEVLFQLDEVSRESGSAVGARFTYSASMGPQDSLRVMASGSATVEIGQCEIEVLPPQKGHYTSLAMVDVDQFYRSLQKLGYDYLNQFRSLSDLKRRMGAATGTIYPPDREEARESPYLVHPAVLDAGIQVLLLAHSCPWDGRLRSIHVPTKVDILRINPALCGVSMESTMALSIDAQLPQPGHGDVANITGDVEMYRCDSRHAAIQLGGVTAKPLAAATAADDRQLFFSETWWPHEPNATGVDTDEPGETINDVVRCLERASLFYLRRLREELISQPLDTPSDVATSYLNYADHIISLAETGLHPWVRNVDNNDTLEDILAVTAAYSEYPEVRLVHAIGENIHSVLEGRIHSLDLFLADDLLNKYYEHGEPMRTTNRWLSRVVEQISRKYTNMRVLEVGAGTGSATKAILGRIGDQFASYTFTDVSSGYFDGTEALFGNLSERLNMKVLDISRDIEAQGFTPHSYDLVIACLVLHVTPCLEDTLRNVRSLIKPGGYLVFSELTSNNISRMSFVFGALPGWWSGSTEGRELGPSVSAVQWDDLLRRTGFSGVDSIAGEKHDSAYPGTVMVAQAIDDQVQFLRHPLWGPSRPNSGYPIPQLVLLGGASLTIATLVGNLCQILLPSCQSVLTFKSLEDLRCDSLHPDAVFLSMVELDAPLFSNIRDRSLQALKDLLSVPRKILWIAEGCGEDDIYSAMTLAFIRSACWEIPDMSFQFLRWDHARLAKPSNIAEYLLRFVFLTSLRGESARNKLLWSCETEMRINERLQAYIPRLEPARPANERYNSSVRRVTRPSSPSSAQRVALCLQHGRHAFVHCRDESLIPLDSDHVELVVELCTIWPLRYADGELFLVLGSVSAEAAIYLALTPSVASHLVIPRHHLVECELPEGRSKASAFAFVFDYLVAVVILDGMEEGSSLMVHNSPKVLGDILQVLAVERTVTLTLTTSGSGNDIPESWIRILPYSLPLQVKPLLPPYIDRLVDLTVDPNTAQSIPGYIGKQYPVRDLKTLFGGDPGQWTRTKVCANPDVLRLAIRHAHSLDAPMGMSLTDSFVITPQQLEEKPQLLSTFVVLDWSVNKVIPERVTTAGSGVVFRGDRTYWLAGISGSLCLSLCEWMISRGARYIVISSRQPRINPLWLNRAKQLGATVLPCANDITKYDQVEELYQNLNERFPPVAGIAHGAMVLRDTPVRDMTYDDLCTVLAPKLTGGLNLDRLFRDKQLDFFILLSSLVSVVGHASQANYAAANGFLDALTGYRRNRGLNASSINLGVIAGSAVVSGRAGSSMLTALLGRGFMGLSEADFHEAFAEAIAVGKVDESSESAVITGLARVNQRDKDARFMPVWTREPKFSLLLTTESPSRNATVKRGNTISIKSRLRKAKTETDVRAIVMGTLCSRLRQILQLGSDMEITRSTRTDQLGLDSLIAVDLRSWLSQTYGVNIPALQIMSGMEIGELVQLTVDDLDLESVRDSDETDTISSGSEDLVEETPPGSSPLWNSDHQASMSPTSSPGSIHPAQEVSKVPSSEQSFKFPMDANESSSPTTTPASTPQSKEMRPTQVSCVSTKEQSAIVRSGGLSSSQSMFWFIDSLMEKKSTLNHTLLYRIHGTLNVTNLERAVRVVTMRHEILRTRIRYDETTQEIHQEVLQEQLVFLEQRHVQDASDVDNIYNELHSHIYDTSAGCALRVIHILCASGDSFILIGYHHLVVDGSSHAVIMRDLQDTYQGRPFAAKPVQFLDYVREEQKKRASHAWSEDIRYWKGVLEPMPEPLPVHRSRVATRPLLKQYDMHRVEYTLPGDLHSRLSRLAVTYRATPFHVYLAAFQVLIFRFLGVQDICIGAGDANRWDAEKNDRVGPYINLVPLRFRVDQDMTFAAVTETTRSTSYDCLQHAQVPFQVLLNELQISRSATHSPVFQAFLDYRLVPESDGSFGDCRMDLERWDIAQLGYDFMVDIAPHPIRGMSIAMHVQRSLYGETEAGFLAQGYEDILKELVMTPDHCIGRLWKFRSDDLNRAFELGRGPGVASSWPTTIPHQVDAIAKQHGDRTAIREATGAEVTYSDLLRRVDSIALAMVDSGLMRGAPVAVYQEPSIESIASVLAILKAGGVYVPLELSIPPGRLAAMVQSVNPKVVLVHDATSGLEKSLQLAENAAIINVSSVPQHGLKCGSRAFGNGPAVILHTSGTTGVPKGVLLTHANLRNHMEFSMPLVGIRPGHVVLYQSASSFDLSLAQILGALCYGATVCVAKQEMRYDPEEITHLIHRAAITHTIATPTEYKSWLKCMGIQTLQASAWSTALVAGELVTQDLLENFRVLAKDGLRLFNMYGPCETTIWSTATELDYSLAGKYAQGIPVGRPCCNERLYIVDEMLQPQAFGLPGEIVIGGAGVAEGYVNLDGETKARFLEDTFRSPQLDGQTMYRTGDRGRLLEDGQLILEGRVAGDTVVKLHGVRIDLRDVEQSILRVGEGALVDVAASIRGGTGPSSAYLVAHVVFSEGFSASQDRSQFLRQLRDRLDLPSTMCPSMVPLAQLPRTVSGKLDRAAIQDLPVQSPIRSKDNDGKLSILQERVKQLWLSAIPAELVAAEHIDHDTDFFHVGGDSMLLIDLHRSIAKEFHSSISLLRLFQHSTLEGMSSLVSPDGADSPISHNMTPCRDAINWDIETAPFIRDTPLGDMAISPPSPLPRTIVVTGATGLLGQALLEVLERHPQVGTVICLAVRGLQARKELLGKFRKVEYIEGDLALPLLGLDQPTASRVFRHADAVIHNGADTSQAKSYTTLRPVNLQSTKELASLCAWRRIPLHYVSTASVLLLGGRDGRDIDINHFSPPTSGAFGYVSSKWASECYLHRANRKHGLPVSIYRPSQLVSSNASDPGQPSFGQTLLDYVQRLQKLPDIPRVMETLRFDSVDRVARAVVRSVLGNNRLRDLVVPLERDEKPMEILSKSGGILPTVALSEWILCAEEMGMSSGVAAMFRQLEEATDLLAA